MPVSKRAAPRFISPIRTWMPGEAEPPIAANGDAFLVPQDRVGVRTVSPLPGSLV